MRSPAPSSVPLFLLLFAAAACEEEVTLPRQPNADESRFDIMKNHNGDLPTDTSPYCADQAVYVPKQTRLSMSAPGLACEFTTCSAAQNPTGPVLYTLTQEGTLKLDLGFSHTLLSDGYSLDAFKRAFNDSARVTWWTTPTLATATSALGFEAFTSDVEFLTYEAPHLHVRVRAEALLSNPSRQTATSPYLCSQRDRFTGLPVNTRTCTEVLCTYYAADDVNGAASLVAELRVPIDPLTP